MEVPENIAHLEMLAEDIPTPEGLKRPNYCRCKFACFLDSTEADSLRAILGEEHRGKRTVRNKVIQACKICRFSRCSTSLINYCDGKKLSLRDRVYDAATIRYKRFSEQQFREHFHNSDTPASAMAYLRTFLPEAMCLQLEYIMDRIGYDLDFQWIR